MKQLAPYVGNTPRRALRFLNVYRVIKASLRTEDLHSLERDGGYRGLMTQLGVTTGAPALRQPWSNFLKGVAGTGKLPEIDMLLKGQDWFKVSPDSPQLHGAITTFWAPWKPPGRNDGEGEVGETENAVNKALQNGIANLRNYDELAKRYSFGP